MSRSKANGKPVVYLSPETKGGIIEVINHDIPEPEKKIFMSESGLRFITYDQAITWMIGKVHKAEGVD